jgi:hypothetical protein
MLNAKVDDAIGVIMMCKGNVWSDIHAEMASWDQFAVRSAFRVE